jgi:hypothetical protein
MSIWTPLKEKAYADAIPGDVNSYYGDVWRKQAAVYRNMWDYFDGDVFDETLNDRTDDKKYPLGINLFASACVNHRATLLGEYIDDVLTFRVKSSNQDANEVEDKLDVIWTESGRNSILLEGALIAQVLGGIVYRVVFNPYRKRVYVRMIQPDAFFPIWNPDDYHDIMECYVMFYIDPRTARLRYNVDLKNDSREPFAVYQEHWTRDYYEVTIDGKTAFWDRGKRFPIAGRNPYKDPRSGQGIIPFEYFPRDRAGEFYGIPLGKNALQLQDEYNLRAADLGDAILESTHVYKFLRHRPKGTKGLQQLSRNKLNDLGMGAPGKDAPEVFAVEGGKLPPGAVEWLEHLRSEGRTSMFSPPVSYGQDEGSQRSALTLAFRMWPLTQAVRTVRGYWTDSFYNLNRKIIIVASTKSKEGGGYNLLTRHAEYRTIPVWSPMLPRDRESEVNEVVIRKANGLISVEHGVEKLEDGWETSKVQEEVKRIRADQKREAELLAQQSPYPNQKQNNQSAPSKMPSS